MKAFQKEYKNFSDVNSKNILQHTGIFAIDIRKVLIHMDFNELMFDHSLVLFSGLTI